MSKQQKGQQNVSKQQDQQRKQDDDMKIGKKTPAGQSWNDKKDVQGKVSTKSNQ